MSPKSPSHSHSFHKNHTWVADQTGEWGFGGYCQTLDSGVYEVLQAGESSRYLWWAPSAPSGLVESSNNMLPRHGPNSGADDRSFKIHTSPICSIHIHRATIDKSYGLFTTQFAFMNNQVT